MSSLFIHGGLSADGVPIELCATDGVIEEIGASVSAPAGSAVIDASGLLLLPGAPVSAIPGWLLARKLARQL